MLGAFDLSLQLLLVKVDLVEFLSHARHDRHKHLDSIEETNLSSFLINCEKLGCARTRKRSYYYCTAGGQ